MCIGYMQTLGRVLFCFVFGCIGSLLLCAGFSLVAASGGYSLLWCAGFSVRWLLLLLSTGWSRGLSSCGSQALERRLSSCGTRAYLLCGNVGSSWTRARTTVPCDGRRILNHCAMKEVPRPFNIRHLNMCGFWYPTGESGTNFPVLHRYEGTTVYLSTQYIYC